MKNSNFFAFLLLVVVIACTSIEVHAMTGLPDVSESTFQGRQGVVTVIADSGEKHLAVLAKKEIVIEQIQYKKQKTLSLKAKKILFAYFKQKNANIYRVELQRLLPLKYWEKDNYAYLISIIKSDNVKIITAPASPPQDKKVQPEKDNSKAQKKKTVEKKNDLIDPNKIDENDTVKPEVIPEPKTIEEEKELSIDELKKLYQEMFKTGDTKKANEIFQRMQKKIRNH